ncbi:MAG: small ribosomal subunit biogenesis GTPase RsgA [Motiliproteus sp.]
MAKRKLTRRQSWRIEKIQNERAARAQKKDHSIDQQLTSGDLGSEQEGLVISHFGSQVDIEALDGEHRGVIKRCHMRANLGSIVTGDRVVWRDSDSMGVVVATLPRHSLLSRPNIQGEMRAVAANIDTIIITIAPEPTPHANLIDRYLVAAEAVDIEPVILLNKTDLLNDDNRQDLEQMLQNYHDIGYRTISASATSEQGLMGLKAHLDNHISVFVGQSGVGKSSLINVLLPGVDIRVGALSESTAKGTHTTTTARLYHFPDGGDLIDSPGIREFGLWHIDKQTLLEGFKEFRPFLGHCRFRDCNHEQEPACALLQALDSGAISSKRMASYRHILNSLDQT